GRARVVACTVRALTVVRLNRMVLRSTVAAFLWLGMACAPVETRRAPPTPSGGWQELVAAKHGEDRFIESASSDEASVLRCEDSQCESLDQHGPSRHITLPCSLGFTRKGPAIAVSPNGRFLALTCRDLEIVDLETGKATGFGDAQDQPS